MFVQMIVYFYFLYFLLSMINADVIILSEKNVTVGEYMSLPANFGPQIPYKGFMGYLFLANPEDACKEIEKPPATAISTIALIRRSRRPDNSCPFDVKIRNAAVSSYNAAIVYNDQSDDLVVMQSSGQSSSINISSVFVGLSAGMILQSYAAYPNNSNFSRDYCLLITHDDFKGLRFYLIPFIIVLIMTFAILSVIMACRYIVRFRRECRNRLPRSALKKIPVKKFSKADLYDICAICLDEYVEGVKIRILFCGHAYHVKCIDPWLIHNKRTCPVCKRRVLRSSRSSQSSDSELETTPLLNEATVEDAEICPVFARSDSSSSNVTRQSHLSLSSSSIPCVLAREEEQGRSLPHANFYIGSVERGGMDDELILKDDANTSDVIICTDYNNPDNDDDDLLVDPNVSLISGKNKEF